MAKTIKFNLICDETPIRTIEDLQEHFCIDDILPYYQKGILQRWLEVRGYTGYLKKVSAIKAKAPAEIILALVQIFDIPVNAEQVKRDTYIWEFRSQRAEQLRAEVAANTDAQKTVAEYLLGYARLEKCLDDAVDDPSRVKAIVTAITKEYPLALAMCHRALFWKFLDKAPLVIMRLIMDAQSRDYFLPVYKSNQNGTVVSDMAPQSGMDPQADKREMFMALCNRIGTFDFQKKLGDSLQTFEGMTKDGAWVDLVPKGQAVMVLSLEGASLVRPAGAAYVENGAGKVNKQFPIYDGLDYKCRENRCKLLYMEV